jgi:YacP-like NYN domain
VATARSVELSGESTRALVKFVLDAAAAGRVTIPDALRPLLRARPDGKVVRRIQADLEQRPEFREQLAAHATADLLDGAALAWLRRPPGWEQVVAEAGSSAEGRRLRAVEDKLVRGEQQRRALEADLRRAREQLEAANKAVEPLQAEINALRSAADQASGDARRERRRAAALVDELERANGRRAELERALADQRARRDGLPATLAEVGALVDQLGDALARAAAAAAPLADPPTTRPARPPTPRRRRQRLPGGVREGTAEAARHLLGTPAVHVLVDGYNVAKLGWPGEQLAGQRALCVSAAGDVARRWRLEITVVFDGSEVIGAAGPGRKGVRVEFSPDGVEADDVLRRRVGELPVDVAVVVVTEDRAIIADVTAAGADVVSSAVFLGLAHSG